MSGHPSVDPTLLHHALLQPKNLPAPSPDYYRRMQRQHEINQHLANWAMHDLKLRHKPSGTLILRWHYLWGATTIKMKQKLPAGLIKDRERLEALLKKVAQPEWGEALLSGRKLADLLMEETL